MIRSFLLSLSKAIPHGITIAVIAFPAGIIAITLWALLFFGLIFLLFIPFLPIIIAFLLSHAVWVFAARMAGRLSGMDALGARVGYVEGYWRAFPLAAVLTVVIAALEWTVTAAEVVDLDDALPAQVLEMAATLQIWLTPLWEALGSLVMALILVPSANGLHLRSAKTHGGGAMALRLLVALPAVAMLTWLAAQPVVVALQTEGVLDELKALAREDLRLFLDFVSVPVFYLGVLYWLSAALFLAFEAHFAARLEALGLAERFSEAPPEDKVDYRDLRDRWSREP